jgi:hypothetical protein
MRPVLLIVVALSVSMGCGKKTVDESSPEPSVPKAPPTKPERIKPEYVTPEPVAPGKKAKPIPVTAAAIGQDVTFGDLVVKPIAVIVRPFQMSDFAIHEPSLIILLEIRNNNPNRIIDVPSQFGTAKVTDDVGNTYRELQTLNASGDGIWYPLPGRTEMIHQREARLRSEKPTTDVVLFERPVLGATKVTIDLDASKYGGEGVIRIEVPRSVWELPAPKVETKVDPKSKPKK